MTCGAGGVYCTVVKAVMTLVQNKGRGDLSPNTTAHARLNQCQIRCNHRVEVIVAHAKGKIIVEIRLCQLIGELHHTEAIRRQGQVRR